MTVKKLNLDTIQDEILDECFEDSIQTFEVLVSASDEDNEDDDNTSDDVSASIQLKKPTQQQYISNEELVTNIQNNIDVEKSKEMIVMFNSGLVYNEAKNCTCNIPFQDKVQYGFEGLMKAIYLFNPALKTRFSTYATWAVRQHMYRNGNNDVRIVALPEHLSMFNIRIQDYIERHMADTGGYPTNEQISTGTGIDVRSVKRVLNYNSNMFSMDTPVTSDGNLLLQDTLTGASKDYNVDERCVNKDFLDAMEEIMDELHEHERVLLGLINGLDGYRIHTFEEIITTGYIDNTGKLVTSKATLSRRYNLVLDKVRKIIERKGINFDDK